MAIITAAGLTDLYNQRTFNKNGSTVTLKKISETEWMLIGDLAEGDSEGFPIPEPPRIITGETQDGVFGTYMYSENAPPVLIDSEVSYTHFGRSKDGSLVCGISSARVVVFKQGQVLYSSNISPYGNSTPKVSWFSFSEDNSKLIVSDDGKIKIISLLDGSVGHLLHEFVPQPYKHFHSCTVSGDYLYITGSSETGVSPGDSFYRTPVDGPYELELLFVNMRPTYNTPSYILNVPEQTYPMLVSYTGKVEIVGEGGVILYSDTVNHGRDIRVSETANKAIYTNSSGLVIQDIFSGEKFSYDSERSVLGVDFTSGGDISVLESIDYGAEYAFQTISTTGEPLGSSTPLVGFRYVSHFAFM